MNYKEKIGTNKKPLRLKTPPQSSEYTMHVEEKEGVEILICTVGPTVLHYNISCLNDLHAMLKEHGDWKEHWGRSSENPLGGWYGLKKNFRGRFGMYISPLKEALGLAEVTHEKKGNKMSAI